MVREATLNHPDAFESLPGYDTINIKKYQLIKRTLGAYYDESLPNPLIEKVLKHLKLGGIWTDIIEDDQSYLMLKLLSENDSVYHCGVIRRAKLGFDTWFKEYITQHVPIVFYDKKFLDDLKMIYPELSWLRFARYVRG